MSPKIGVSVDVRAAWAREGRSPRMKVLAAAAWARSEGLGLRFGGDLGVQKGGLSGAWVRDRRVVGGLTLIGAVLLSLQPEGSHDEDPNAAAARALGTPLAFVEGVDAGWTMEPGGFWLNHADAQHYRNGMDLGAEVRFMASVVCPCGARRMKGETICPACDQ